ncbi:hypothetical protein JCM16303_000962 [Sporobolomyces ruberrimus]
MSQDAQVEQRQVAVRVSKRSVSDTLATLDAACRDSLGSTKKRRTAAPPSVPTSTPALEAILARNAPRSSPSTAPPPASYEPTSLPSLLSRLSTYKLSTYSPSKPRSLSPLNCALHGWINKGSRERLECVTCRKGLVLLPPSTGGWVSPAGQSLTKEYERSVLENGQGHDQTCPWRMRPCSRGLYKLEGGGLGVNQGGRRKLLEVVGKQAKDMNERGFDKIQLELPQKVKELIEEPGAEEKLLKSVTSLLPSTNEESNSTDPTPLVSTTTLLLSIFGWSLDPLPIPSTSSQPPLSRSTSSSSISSLRSITSSSTPILSCHYCLRQILTTSYLPSSSTSTSTSSDQSSPPELKSFNPSSQHYPYCPFIDTTSFPSTQATTTTPSSSSPPRTGTSTKTSGTIKTKKPGYQIRLESILQKPSFSTLAAHTSTNSTGATGDGRVEGGIEQSTKSSKVKTRELLSYVRGLLGPKLVVKPKPL